MTRHCSQHTHTPSLHPSLALVLSISRVLFSSAHTHPTSAVLAGAKCAVNHARHGTHGMAQHSTQAQHRTKPHLSAAGAMAREALLQILKSQWPCIFIRAYKALTELTLKKSSSAAEPLLSLVLRVRQSVSESSRSKEASEASSMLSSLQSSLSLFRARRLASDVLRPVRCEIKGPSYAHHDTQSACSQRGWPHRTHLRR
jgi:hypothetical protein